MRPPTPPNPFAGLNFLPVTHPVIDSAPPRSGWISGKIGSPIPCPSLPGVKSRKRKLEDNDSDDECLVLDGDPEKLASVRGSGVNDGGLESDDLLVVGETGQVACRDYPHSRHDCIKFPFKTTPHAEHCDLCHCYVCDLPVPCIYWGTGTLSSDHCHAIDKDGYWKYRRMDFKLGKNAGQNNLSNDCGTLPSMAPLANQNIQPGIAQSAAKLTPQNPVFQEVTTQRSGRATVPVNTPRHTNLTPQNLVSRPAVYHPSSQALSYGNTSPVNPQNHEVRVRPPIHQRCSSSVSYGTSDNICLVKEQWPAENLRTGIQPLHAPRMVSPRRIVVQPDGCHFKSSVRPQHVSSVSRFNKAGIAHCTPASNAGYAPNNLYGVTAVQFGRNFQKHTANTHRRSHFRSDMRSAQFNAPARLPNAVPSGSSGVSHPRCPITEDGWTVNPIYQQIQDARDPPPPTAAVDISMLLFDFETPWNCVTR